jgi:hypothetical protein
MKWDGGCKARRRPLQRPQGVTNPVSSRKMLERSATEGDSPVDMGIWTRLLDRKGPAWLLLNLLLLTLSTTGHANPVGSREAHPPKAKHSWRPIVNKYREGKVKRTPVRGVK